LGSCCDRLNLKVSFYREGDIDEKSPGICNDAYIGLF